MTDLIYKPKGKAGEYASLACNHYRGCDHGCEYCYVPNVLRCDKGDFHENVTPRLPPDAFLAQLDKDAARWRKKLGPPPYPTLDTLPQDGDENRILLSFTCDPYCIADVQYELTREVIKVLHRHLFRVTTLTKGGTRALRDIDLFFPGIGGDHFASTLTLTDPVLSRQVEPGAATPYDRVEALRAFSDVGVHTWVSLEPVIDIYRTLTLIEVAHQYVDFWKVGKMNHQVTTIDWAFFAREVVALLDSLGAKYLIKEDLRKYL